MTDRLQKAIVEWFEALKSHEKALGEYDGYSWDWAGHYHIECLDKAKTEFNNALDELIDIKMNERLRGK